MKRIFFDIVLFLSVFILPWWIGVILGLLGMFLFKEFYEFLAFGVVMYILYAIPGQEIIASQIWFHVILVCVFIGIQFLRRHAILYKNEI